MSHGFFETEIHFTLKPFVERKKKYFYIDFQQRNYSAFKWDGKISQ